MMTHANQKNTWQTISQTDYSATLTILIVDELKNKLQKLLKVGKNPPFG